MREAVRLGRLLSDWVLKAGVCWLETFIEGSPARWLLQVALPDKQGPSHVMYTAASVSLAPAWLGASRGCSLVQPSAIIGDFLLGGL